jgi:iron-sulfur cluster repair protein YtfE (RIC family)
MTEQVRDKLDALELLMQDHREMESLFREFEYLRQNRKDTGRVIANACAELKIHDTLETEVFYAAVGAATGDKEIERLLDEAEDEHDAVLELIEELAQTRTDHKQRDECFTIVAEHVKQHVLREETELFPLVKQLKQLDLEPITAAMKKRKGELIADMGITEADEETV